MQIKKYLTLGLFFFSLNTFANCSPDLQDINVQIKKLPLLYDYSQNSNQLQALSQKMRRSNSYVAGLFTGDLQVQSYSQQRFFGNEKMGFCGTINKVETTIIFSPKIYIASETKNFPCKRQVAELHEQIHYKIEDNFISNLKPQIEDLIRKYYNVSFNSPTPNGNSSYTKQIDDQFLAEIQEISRKYSEPLHAKLDSLENYKIESSYCSLQENIELGKLIKSN